MKLAVNDRELDNASEDLNKNEKEYQEYFEYVMAGLAVEMPTNWEDALEIYQRFLNIAKDN